MDRNKKTVGWAGSESGSRRSLGRGTAPHGGRNTGVPSAGAIGGGDSSDKLGRARRYPFYIGNTGSPSLSADSGISTSMSRVNKGYKNIEDELITVMFPEQEDDEGNIYYREEPELKTRKLSTSVVLSPGGHYVAGLGESSMKRNYSLIAVYDNNERESLNELSLGDLGIDLPNIDLPSMEDIGSQVDEWTEEAGDWVRDNLGPLADPALMAGAALGNMVADLAIGILAIPPIAGDALMVSLAAFNLGQLSQNNADAEVVMQMHDENPTDESFALLAEQLEKISGNLQDFVTRMLQALPDPGGSELVAAGISAKRHTGTLMTALRSARGALSSLGFEHSRANFIQQVKAAAKRHTATGPALQVITSVLASDHVSDEIKDGGNTLTTAVMRMGELQMRIEEYRADEYVSDELGLEDPNDAVAMAGEPMSGMSQQPMYMDIPMIESRNIRALVRESLLAEDAHRYTPNLNGPSPAGYMSYRPYELDMSGEISEEDEHDRLTRYAIRYQTDGGGSTSDK